MRTVFGMMAAGKPARRPSRVPDGMRVYAIGDVHGENRRLDELHALIADDAAAAPGRQTVVVYLGDYIDRGPDSAGVIERLATRTIPGIASGIFLKGNHEAMLATALADHGHVDQWKLFGGQETLLSYRVPQRVALAAGATAAIAAGRALAEQIPAHHLTFLAGLQNAVTIGDYFFCHAGVRPGVALAEQREADLLWIRGEFLDCRDDFGLRIVHGHTPVETPEVHANRINIDTGAYATGRLTAAVLDGDEVRFLMAGR